MHAYGAAFDNPDLIVACVVGDGEAETGPLAASWHSNKFLNPAHDGAVLPILHLNGYKIANPTVLGRMRDEEIRDLFKGYGHEPLFVEGGDPKEMHVKMADALDVALASIRSIQQHARVGRTHSERPQMAHDRAAQPEGLDGSEGDRWLKVEGFWRAHQVPIAHPKENPAHLQLLEAWMRSYAPEELFDAGGRLIPELQALAPKGNRRMGANPHANGGLLKRELKLPDFRRLRGGGAVAGRSHGRSDPRTWQVPPRGRAPQRKRARNFRIMGPDETASNRLDAVFEATERVWMETIEPYDVHLAQDGRVMEVLSEHLCQGWLEGYLLTGRHGLFSCYEAFIHIVDSMFNQHAKWLKVSRELSWRRPIASLNYLLTSHVWRQDHNGFSHQDPGFVDLVANKKADIVRVYLPPDANTLALGHRSLPAHL